MVIPYNSTLSIDRIQNETFAFSFGNKFLEQYEDHRKHASGAMIVKDPRLSITLKTWLHFLKKKTPAVLFTHRHPIDVSRSFRRRDRLNSNCGLAMWIAYNQLAIQNSVGGDLCVVRIRYNDFMDHNQTLREIRRIVKQ